MRPLDPWKSFNGSNAQTRDRRYAGVLKNVLALDDFEPLAKNRLPKAIYGYVSGAAEQNATRDDNLAAFRDWSFLPRVLQNVAGRDQSVELFGKTYASPIGIAPMGIAALSAYKGDEVLARAAQDANIPFVLSGTGLTRLETIANAAPQSWFQAYLPGSAERIAALIDRVANAGYQTLVVTVDVPVAGNRENNLRAGFSTPLRPTLRLMWDGITHPKWTCGVFLRTLMDGMPHFENSFAERGAPVMSKNVNRDFTARDHFDWLHIAQIRKQWTGNLVIKGILSRLDALRAKEEGADGIILSNHGGRQLDGAISPLRVLPEVIAAVGATYPVMQDGGVRRGSDVLKALALGARMVWVGRPFNYAAAVAAQAGVAHAIELLMTEIDRNMAMLGVRDVQALNAEFLRKLKT